MKSTEEMMFNQDNNEAESLESINSPLKSPTKLKNRENILQTE